VAEDTMIVMSDASSHQTSIAARLVGSAAFAEHEVKALPLGIDELQAKTIVGHPTSPENKVSSSE
jgi:hypothetical protein